MEAGKHNACLRCPEYSNNYTNNWQIIALGFPKPSLNCIIEFKPSRHLLSTPSLVVVVVLPPCGCSPCYLLPTAAVCLGVTSLLSATTILACGLFPAGGSHPIKVNTTLEILGGLTWYFSWVATDILVPQEVVLPFQFYWSHHLRNLSDFPGTGLRYCWITPVFFFLPTKDQLVPQDQAWAFGDR